MRPKRAQERQAKSAGHGPPPARSALPGRGGLARIAAAFWNSLRGLQEGLSTESAIKQEVARDLWTWVALVASLLFVLSIEFLNTAIERLCNHIEPDKHEAIRITKDLASAGVFFALALAALVWIAALWARFMA